jgi:hypothetical protein
LFGAGFRVMLFSVRNHLGDLLELKKRFGQHSFNPVFIGPQMVFSVHPVIQSVAPCIIQVIDRSLMSNSSRTDISMLMENDNWIRRLIT